MKIETELTKTENIKEINKKLFMFLLVMIIGCAMVFAGDKTSTDPKGLDGIDTIKQVFQTIYEFFTSSAVRIIAIAGVIFTGVKIITNKGNPEAIKSLIPIFIACIIIGCASWFVGKFMGNQIEQVDTTQKGWWKTK